MILPRAVWEHLLTGILAVLITWVGSDVVPVLQHQTGPWAVVALILAGLLQAANPWVTSFGVGSKPGRHEAPPTDAGIGGPDLLAGVLAAAVLASIGVAVWRADPADAAPPGPVMPHVTAVQDCHGTLWVAYGLEILRGRQMQIYLDDGRERLELLEVSGRSGPGGQWQRIPATPGGEGRLRWPGLGRAGPRGAHYAFARVVRTDRDRIVSTPALITEGCPA